VKQFDSKNMKKTRWAALFAGIMAAVLASTSTLQHVSFAASSKTDPLTETDEIHAAFPESYWEGLDALKKAHPNWKFVAFYTGLDWEDVMGIDAESEPLTNLVEAFRSNGKMYYPTSWYSTSIPGAYNWVANSWTPYDSGNWYQASIEAIEYCMDPRNFLTEMQIFQFLDSSSPLDEETALAAVSNVFSTIGGSHWTQSGEMLDLYYMEEVPNPEYQEYLDGIEAGTWTITYVPDETIEQRHYLTYAEAVTKIATELGLNQVTIASRIRQEQGLGTSSLISGTQEFTVTVEGEPQTVSGYYNYFNIGASGSSREEITRNGLTEAYKGGWDTRYKALAGGAEKYSSKFIKYGQTTLYFQKFFVDSSYPQYLYWKQYMQNLNAPQSEAKTAYNSFLSADALDSDLTFIIPIYSNMPETAAEKPTKDGNPNYKLASISVGSEMVEGFDMDTADYETISFDNEVLTALITARSYATTTRVKIINRYLDENEEEQEDSYDAEYTLLVTEDVSRGNHTADIRLHFGNNNLSIISTAENGDSFTYHLTIFRDTEAVYGDINDDGEWNIYDIVYMQSHLLGKNTLTGKAFEAADLYMDGEINIYDLVILQSYLLGKSETIQVINPNPPTEEPTSESEEPTSETESSEEPSESSTEVPEESSAETIEESTAETMEETSESSTEEPTESMAETSVE